MEKENDLKPIRKSELRKKYEVSVTTFTKYLKSVPGLVLGKADCLIFPNDLRKIYDHLGEP